jgi:hypothetical protein
MGNLPLARPEILFKTDKTIVLLELKHDGKFAVKTNGWEDSRVIREGKKLQVMVVHGRWVLLKAPVPFAQPTMTIGVRQNRRLSHWDGAK